jgi:hypothetical protein
MKKIKTIFDRDWDGTGGVVNTPVEGLDLDTLKNAKATEKIDGTNVRLTVRKGTLVRLEKRRNPTKLEKAKGIEEPWYIDADEYAPNDKFMWEAARNTDLSDVPDGEWSGEAVGPSVQGNTLNIPDHRVVMFSLGRVPTFENVPLDYDTLKVWLKEQDSKYGTGKIEGIVWHFEDGTMYKIKTKDFK